MKAIGVIPARLAATRLPNKPLLDIAGKPMVQWVWEQASKAVSLDKVIVATPDPEIAEACVSFGAPAALTSPEHPTGTDRVAEAVASEPADIIVNIQGDEPLTDPGSLDALVAAMVKNPRAALGSLMFELTGSENADDPNLVKVVTSDTGYALYFSRLPIPYPRGIEKPARFGHVGIYAWRREKLFEFTRLPRSPLEIAESLEQLRALSAGWPVLMVQTDYRPIGVDTPEDLERVRRSLDDAR